jgi:hypothetical protein
MSGKKRVLTPADKDYWDKEFYVDGEGSGDTYEWYIDYDVRHALGSCFWSSGFYLDGITELRLCNIFTEKYFYCYNAKLK